MKIKNFSLLALSVAGFSLFFCVDSVVGATEVPIPVGGSIAAPGQTTAIFTNPAGLGGPVGARLSLQAGSDHPMDDPTYRGLVIAGVGPLTAAAGLDYQMFDAASPADRGYAVYGLSLQLPVLDWSFGFSGETGIKEDDGSDFHAGMILSPIPFFDLGLTARGIRNEVDSYGLGLALDLIGGVSLVLDSAYDSDFKNGEFKPGIRLANSFAGLSVSYGTGSTDQFAEDFSGSAYIRVGSNSELELIYNHGGRLPKYYAALSFGF